MVKSQSNPKCNMFLETPVLIYGLLNLNFHFSLISICQHGLKRLIKGIKAN